MIEEMVKIIPYASEWDAAIDALIDEVMGPGRYARTAERLREGNRAIADYGFVVIDDQKNIQGTISFWPIQIGATPSLLLGPLAIHPAFRGQGAGLNLITYARDHILSRDPSQNPLQNLLPILLVGDEPYYGRVGFSVAPRAIQLPGPVNPDRVLIWLPEGAAMPTGEVRAHPRAAL